MKADLLKIERYSTPTTDAPHELSEAVNRIESAGLFTETYNRPYWLAMVKRANYAHPSEEIKKLLKVMYDRQDWLTREKKQVMNCGGWLTNRLNEMASGKHR